RAQTDELLLLHRCRGDWRFLASFCKRRLWPWHQHRRELLDRLNPRWTLPGEGEQVPLGPLGNRLGLSESVAADYRVKILRETHDLYHPSLRHFVVAESSRRAICETAELCRAEGIELTLLLTPEGSDFRSWYSAESVAAVEQFCGELNRDYGLRLIDARRWLPDDEFVDSHHMLAAGADRFTRRLGERLEAIHLARTSGGALR
ncbi:MAG TPA: hypothetical protein VFW87_12990, partial [Pirellulales bacterium]|nr:hypothetical protein [Pirellulales bacterium]